MFTIALTGGIATGKSTVADLFSQLGVPIVDADEIVHKLMRAGQPAYPSVVKIFGSGILDSSGEIDRKQLRNIVFRDDKQRKNLEQLLHPLVYAEIERWRRTQHTGYGIAVIPLLIETGQQERFDRVLVVDIPEEQQRQRLADRQALLSSNEIDAILDAQVSRQQRLDIADDIIDNSGNLTALRHQVEALHRKYQEMCH